MRYIGHTCPIHQKNSPKMDSANRNSQPRQQPSNQRVEINPNARERNALRIENLKEYFKNDPRLLLELDRNMVEILKQIPDNKPNANYFCTLCNYYCDNVGVVHAHMNNVIHKKNLEEHQKLVTIQDAPVLKKPQNGLQLLLLNLIKKHGIDDAELTLRKKMVIILNSLIGRKVPGCHFKLFGPSKHGMGLKSSVVTLDLQMPSKSSASTCLLEVSKALRRCGSVDNVEELFDTSPTITFSFKMGKELRKCSISVFNENAINLADLLIKYAELEKTVERLAIAVCLWAETVLLNRPEHHVPEDAFVVMVVYYLQRCPDGAALSVLNEFVKHPARDEGSSLQVLELDLSRVYGIRRRTCHYLDVHWINFFHFYAVDSPMNQIEIAIDQQQVIPQNSKKIFISDPFSPSRNLLHNVPSPILHYMTKCIMTTCKYFMIPQTRTGPTYKCLRRESRTIHPDFERIINHHEMINTIILEEILRRDSMFTFEEENGREVDEIVNICNENNFCNIDNIPVAYLGLGLEPPRHLYKEMQLLRSQAIKIIDSLDLGNVFYRFNISSFTDGLKPPLVCDICRGDGHLTDKCPLAELPHLNSLACVNQCTIDNLTEVCNQVFDKWKQTEKEVQIREEVLSELELYIRSIHPTARLVLFGSTKNGFGLQGSDMDICLMFEDNATGESLDIRGFIEKLCISLKGLKSLNNLLPIVTAKVPIVKFSHISHGLDGDISMYNRLGMENTNMLLTYSQIDPRVQVLGTMMKRFSKVCCIGDASRGGISSYGFTLMMIYFLQQCNPPVLPVLQQIKREPDLPDRYIVEGHDTYFYNDLINLKNEWPDLGKNNLSVGQLWLELLTFYTEVFQFQKMVVCIRQKEPLTKFDKLWLSKEIAIEDPFDLDHNLGAGLSKRMSLFIVKSFIKGRNHFTASLSADIQTSDNLEEYYFNISKLTDGEPPNDRGCHFCKSPYHKGQICPQKKGGKSKAKKNKGPSKPNEPEEARPSDSSERVPEQRELPASPSTSTSRALPPPPGFSKQDAYTGARIFKSDTQPTRYHCVDPDSSKDIPSIVFKNSKLPDVTIQPLPHMSPPNPMLRLRPPPPPGFVPLPNSPRYNMVAVPPPRPSPAPLLRHSDPADYLQALTMYSSPVLNPRPPMRPPFGYLISQRYNVRHPPPQQPNKTEQDEEPSNRNNNASSPN